MVVLTRTPSPLLVRILVTGSRSRVRIVGGARACTPVLVLVAALLFVPAASGQAPPEAQPPSAAAPLTSPGLEGTAAAAPKRIEGAWRGIVYEGGSRFVATWTLTQNANSIRGSVTETRISGSGSGKYAISGQVNGDVVTYQADNWAARRPPGWCLPAGSLRYSRDSEKEYLAGRLRMNSTAGGCSGHAPTAKRNLTSRGDTGRVMADCSNNSSAGACPRTGFGSIKLERELN